MTRIYKHNIPQTTRNHTKFYQRVEKEREKIWNYCINCFRFANTAFKLVVPRYRSCFLGHTPISFTFHLSVAMQKSTKVDRKEHVYIHSHIQRHWAQAAM